MAKVLRVVILSLAMSLLFCVSAFAASEYPSVPSHSYTQSVADDGAVDEPEGTPGSAMADLNLVVGSIFGILTQIYNLYAGTWLLTGFLMLWLIRRVSMLFQHL